jgi:hypothetical protein
MGLFDNIGDGLGDFLGTVGDFIGDVETVGVKTTNAGLSYDTEEGLNLNIKPASKRKPRTRRSPLLMTERTPEMDMNSDIIDDEDYEDDEDEEEEYEGARKKRFYTKEQ